jgi:hypothetical protein
MRKGRPANTGGARGPQPPAPQRMAPARWARGRIGPKEAAERSPSIRPAGAGAPGPAAAAEDGAGGRKRRGAERARTPGAAAPTGQAPGPECCYVNWQAGLGHREKSLWPPGLKSSTAQWLQRLLRPPWGREGAGAWVRQTTGEGAGGAPPPNESVRDNSPQRRPESLSSNYTS